MKTLPLFILLSVTSITVLCLSKPKSSCPNAKGHLGSSLPQTQDGQYTFYTWGIDLFSSGVLSSTTLNCIQSTGDYATIGLFVGFPTFSPPPISPVSYSSDALQAFFSSSLNKELILYVNFNSSDQTMINSYVQNQLNPYISQKTSIKKVWVRTNIDPDCPSVTSYINCQILSASANSDILNTALNAVTSLGFNAGVYSNAGVWSLAFMTDNSRQAYESASLMFDDYDVSEIQPNFDGYSGFGPWETPEAKMSAYWYIDEKCCWPGQIGWKPKANRQATKNRS